MDLKSFLATVLLVEATAQRAVLKVADAFARGLQGSRESNGLWMPRVSVM
eukprot:CAMPEP_0179845628 /NCGR_PEP_ID=MMETSP0982-20121206/5126_1 /TAXON_ID=483367 /ORGANISM="non described non described, Strain CCMP 2436" /LENGTH=49 /DNA_ID=CAMNT_0021730709 /DNA_START=346 /DNA_END=496 /DNA_ORIENTATION=-